MLDESALASLGRPGGDRRAARGPGCGADGRRRHAGCTTRPPRCRPLREVDALPEEVVRAVAPAGRLRAAPHGPRRVPRRAAARRSPLFVRFAASTTTPTTRSAKLDDFVRRAQRDCSEYGGNVLQLTIGDKGAYLYAVFGSPHAHEDDAARAVAAALELRALDRRHGRARPLKIGLASRPPAQRHLRPRDAAHVRLPRRRRQPRRPADGARAAGRRSTSSSGARGGGRGVRLGVAAAVPAEREGRARRTSTA